MFFTLLNSAMCLNSWCALEAMFRFLTFPPFCYVKIRKKGDFASILTAWFYYVFAKKIDILVRKYVYFMYQVSNISKLLTLISFRTDNFGGKNFQDGGLYTTEFVQINTKINHYPVILFQHNTYEIYLPTYSLIFRKNVLHLKWIFTILILKTFLWIIAMNSLFEYGGRKVFISAYTRFTHRQWYW